MNVGEIHFFPEQLDIADIPSRCRNPFDNNPHPLAIKASHALQQRLTDSPSVSAQLFDKESGKMFGVLVVADKQGKIGYLSGFSGMLNKQWSVPGFVPPVFNIQQQQSFLDEGEKQLSTLTREIEFRQNSEDRLQALARLKKFEQQKEIETESLKKHHKVNKELRRVKRLEINNEQYKTRNLQELSFLSQQDKREFKKFKSDWHQKLVHAHQQFNESYENEINNLIGKRKQLSQTLHKKVFENYHLINKSGTVKTLTHFFDGKIPAGGTGDCAAPKLIQYAHKNNLKILAIAEFWWGSSPAKGVRHHAHFYPPCRGKCFPILPFMLKGVVVEKAESGKLSKRPEPEIVYEDDSLVVLNKPAGLLSIPGKQQEYSVLSWLKMKYPKSTGALLVHRLDMATSGLLLAAKNAQAYKNLQKQFISRNVKKRYVAVVSKVLAEEKFTVELPLRVDLDDRPRQLVCSEHGKPAITQVKVISTDETSSRVYFYPLTGRTHQLRVHAAHKMGLAAPIIGDELYGTRSNRLLLHAESLSFEHPLTGERVEVKSTVPF